MITNEETTRMRRAAGDPDRWAVELDYRDKNSQNTRRQCSPIRRSSSGWLVMCLTTGQPRLLLHAGISNVRLIQARDVLIPAAKRSLANE